MCPPPVAERKRIITLEEFPSYVDEMHKDRDQGYEEEYRVGLSTPVLFWTVGRSTGCTVLYCRLYS